MPSKSRSPLVSAATVLGIDLSINHAAFVQLRGETMDKFTIVTDTKSIVAAGGPGNVRLMVVNETNPEAKECARLSWWQQSLGAILANFEADYVAFEDYAYSAKQGAHQIGEVGGLLRLRLWEQGWRFRKYSPGSIKKFAAHKGRAEKDEMVAAVRDRWGQDFSFLRPGNTKLWTSAEDAADAFSIAQLLITEIRLRKGLIKLDQLHESEIAVFNSVGKKLPPLLSREWIQRS